MTTVLSDYERGLARYNAGAVDAYSDEFAEDAILITPAGMFSGRAAIRDYWARQKVTCPDCVLTPEVVVAQGQVIASEWRWAGTNTGPVWLRDGAGLPPTGKRIEIKGMEVAQMRDGKIVAYHVYWDGLAILRQLGLADAASIGMQSRPVARA